VLKNLMLCGFMDVDVVDLDTIDTSNLNRQFLFRKRDVGSSKAQVAARAALGYNPRARVVAHHANVMTREFDKAFFGQFALVINALDNVAARRHVNRMCVATGLPLIEGGSTGFTGQAYVILPRMTECYECTAKETPKTYPICTIRVPAVTIRRSTARSVTISA
jgi:ubiquitin-like 1-activating enzyme E1 B